ncbi:hypothetical protein N7478_011040 [Penicillium angulare]|uniref:uncharacterized protein n=1 Tax=Penicillium angulare TaxID=116970 RepID=UPI00254241FE|nr:uncharacterized protein N7478_011040 [Penicillium angulare]KAJ5263435.1 hypothetical protein N7478_011040 [Penicillium angulare]
MTDNDNNDSAAKYIMTTATDQNNKVQSSVSGNSSGHISRSVNDAEMPFPCVIAIIQSSKEGSALQII